MKQFIIIVSGPTASGKTELSNLIAQKLPIEVINADIGSMYSPLTIGTAKPNWRESSVPHHLFDIMNTPCAFSITEFRALIEKLIVDIWKRGNIPVVVGGSTMYIKSLLFNLHVLPDTRIMVQNLYHQLQTAQVSTLDLWQTLYQIDSQRAEKIHPHDTYRIVQALAIFYATNKKPSEFEQYFDPVAPFYWIFCTRDRANLYERINQRVVDMFERGWIDEVKKIKGSEWEYFLKQKKIIGYDDILLFLNNEKGKDLDNLICTIQQKTRHYAKRQLLFFNTLKNDVECQLLKSSYHGQAYDLNLTLCDVGLYINGLLNQILQNLK